MAETLTYGFQRQDGVDVRVARIFNTYGPRSMLFLFTLLVSNLAAVTFSEPLRWTCRFKLHRSGTQGRRPHRVW